MTPKEKADELISKYLYPQRHLKPLGKLIVSKECALIAVNEIMNNVCPNNFDYWQQVKKEIELL